MKEKEIGGHEIQREQSAECGQKEKHENGDKDRRGRMEQMDEEKYEAHLVVHNQY